MKKFISEFKEFMSRGNMIELAVAVTMGAAFKSVIDAIVNTLFTPLVGMMIGSDLTTLSLNINEVEFKYGILLQAIANFLVIGFFLFIIIKMINKIKRKPEVIEEIKQEVITTESLLVEIRDLLKSEHGQ